MERVQGLSIAFCPCRIDFCALPVEGDERDDFLPRASPAWSDFDGYFFWSPFGSKSAQGFLRLGVIRGLINPLRLLRRSCDLSTAEVQGNGARRWTNAGWDCGLREMRH